jgi:hypothetical protein
MASNTEKFGTFEIEWVFVPTCHSMPFGHGVQLHYKHYLKDKKHIEIGFIEDFTWYHKKSGLCKIYILTENSKEWGQFQPKAKQILSELKECIYHQVLEDLQYIGNLKGDIFAWPNT